MVYIPFVTMPADEDEATAATNVIGFPRVVLAEQNLRRVRRCMRHAEDSIANDDPRSQDVAERVRAVTSAAMLPEWRAQLREAEAEFAMLSGSDVLTYRGRIYQAVRHSAGAN